MPLYLIDAYNFLHAVVLKGRERANWWSSENQARVVAAVAALVAERQAFEAWVVFDRRGTSEHAGASGGTPVDAAPGVEVHSAPDADDYIVARCAELSGERELWVVTADRSLGDRARRHGARRLSPWAFAAGELLRPTEGAAAAPTVDTESDELRHGHG
ncbi:MAG TPA: NYN domain-containing protein [Polyangiaceae bacterium]|nr:NYN domain-containing protein [Polyangiaceae bacterium]